MYAFAGPARKCDIRSYLENFLPKVKVLEFDILRDANHDLSKADVWAEIFDNVQRPSTVFLTSPPCNTYSRARRRKPGPPPLRSNVWPRGFPWLAPAQASEVQAANVMIDFSLRASVLAAEAGNFFSCGSIQKIWEWLPTVSHRHPFGTCRRFMNSSPGSGPSLSPCFNASMVHPRVSRHGSCPT